MTTTDEEARDNRTRRNHPTPFERDVVHTTVTLLTTIHTSAFGQGDGLPDAKTKAEWIECLTRQRMLLKIIPELSFGVTPRIGFRSLLKIMPWVVKTLESDTVLDRNDQYTLREARRFAMNAIGEHDLAKAQGIDILHAARTLARAKEAVADAEADMQLTIQRASAAGNAGRSGKR